MSSAALAYSSTSTACLRSACSSSKRIAFLWATSALPTLSMATAAASMVALSCLICGMSSAALA